MSTPARVLGFLVGLLVAFGAALGVGHAVGPFHGTQAAGTHDDHTAAAQDQDQDLDEGSGSVRETVAPGGLTASQDGHTLELAQTRAEPGESVPLTFSITGPDGSAVTAFDVRHDELLHLIAVRRDLTGFQHVHPEMSPDGTWSTQLDLTPGQWRLFADIDPAGADPLTLGADLAVPGSYRPEVLEGQSRTVQVDGYTVTLDGGLEPGADARLTISVRRGGTPVTDLEPYLGAYGHLVVLRAGDLAYLHVHPDGDPDDGETEPGPEVAFHTDVPSAGTYRLFLDFKHQGVVRTAAFTLSATGDSVRGHPDDHAGH